MNSLVRFQMHLAFKSFVADVALNWFLLSVGPHVNLQVTSFIKSHAANFAIVLLLTRVNLLMFLAISPVPEGFVTVRAGVRFFPSVCSDMPVKIGLLGKALVTNVASKRLFTTMGKLVSLQVIFFCEALVTLCAQKGSHSMVHLPLMSYEISG